MVGSGGEEGGVALGTEGDVLFLNVGAGTGCSLSINLHNVLYEHFCMYD